MSDKSATTQQRRERLESQCDDLTRRAVDWIIDNLAGFRNTGFRGTTDLECDIYTWLLDHAVFEDGDE